MIYFLTERLLKAKLAELIKTGSSECAASLFWSVNNNIKVVAKLGHQNKELRNVIVL